MMRKIVRKSGLLILTFLAVQTIKAQSPCNIITNSDFENYTSCPTAMGQVNRAVGWYDANVVTGSVSFPSCDYYNCGFYGSLGYPGTPPSGTGYVGLNPTGHGFGHASEMLGTFTNICQGDTYTVSFYSIVGNNVYPTNHPLYIEGINTASFPVPHTAIYCPTIPTTVLVTIPKVDVVNTTWTLRTYTFVSPGNFNAIIIGGVCTGASNDGYYIFLDDFKILTTDWAAYNSTISSNSTVPCGGGNANITFNLPTCPGPFDVVYTVNGSPDTLNNISDGDSISLAISSSTTVTLTTVIDNNGCFANVNSSISYTLSSNPVSATSNSPICAGATLNFMSSGGTNYNWSGPNGFSSSQPNPNIPAATPADSGTYNVIITDSGGCLDTLTVNVIVNPLPDAGALSGTQILCQGDTSNLSTSGDIGGTWSSNNTGVATVNTSGVVTGVSAGTATIKYLVSNTCGSDSATLTITVTTAPTAAASSNSPICAGSTLKLFASGGSNYTWTGPNGFTSTQQNPTISNVSTSGAGIYTVTVSNGGTCTDTATVTVMINPAPSGSACCPATIKSGDNAPLSVTPVNAGYTYQWSPSGSLSCDTCTGTTASPTVTTLYSVIITDSLGCKISSSVLITVVENCGAVYVPTAFSPNGDNFNDVLKVFGNCIKTMDFNIFDRWGNKIFESTDIKTGWDGTYKGKAMNTGTYVFTLKATDDKNKLTEKTGNITLIR